MAKWTVAEAKKDFEKGLFTGFSIKDTSAIMSDVQHWSVEFSVRVGEGGALVDAREEKPRQYRSLDALVSTLQSIGFRAKSLEGK